MLLSFVIKFVTATTFTAVLLATPVSGASIRALNKDKDNQEAAQENHYTIDKIMDKFIINTTDNLDRDLSTRIVGGTQAQSGAYPYYTQWLGGCGASLIHEDIVLTAAHCNVITDNRLIVGAYQDRTTGNGAVSTNIAKRVIHPLFNSNTLVNDFLILKLSTKVTNTVVNINRDRTNPQTGEPLVVVGLGTLSSGGSTPDLLREVTVNMIDHTTCNNQYSGEIDEVAMMCAGVSEGGKDSCQGDSGGPMIEIVNGVHTLVGVVSWGYGCADAAYPGVYSRVSSQIAWIDQQVCALSANPPSRCSNVVSTATPTTAKPTTKPSTSKPSTQAPTNSPVVTKPPTTVKPSTAKPTVKPTIKPTAIPTTKLTANPTVKPTFKPTANPTPTKAPVKVVTAAPIAASPVIWWFPIQSPVI